MHLSTHRQKQQQLRIPIVVYSALAPKHKMLYKYISDAVEETHLSFDHENMLLCISNFLT